MAMLYMYLTIGIPALPSFFVLPAAWKTNTRPTSFVDSLHNAVVYLLAATRYLPLQQNETFHLRFIPDVVSFDDLVKKSELFITDTSPYFNSLLPVGGYTVQLADPLPRNLSWIFDQTDNGVILFSFGSTAHYHRSLSEA